MSEPEPVNQWPLVVVAMVLAVTGALLEYWGLDNLTIKGMLWLGIFGFACFFVWHVLAFTFVLDETEEDRDGWKWLVQRNRPHTRHGSSHLSSRLHRAII